jgi:hypothetical protein
VNFGGVYLCPLFFRSRGGGERAQAGPEAGAAGSREVIGTCTCFCWIGIPRKKKVKTNRQLLRSEFLRIVFLADKVDVMMIDRGSADSAATSAMRIGIIARPIKVLSVTPW